MRGQPGFFDIDDRMKRLSDLGDQLETFRSAVDFELFRPELNAVLSYTERTEGGRPPFDPVLMFKILVIQATNNLSDERAEFLINDRLSFMRFLGLGLEDRVPDARTIWLFREKLTTAGAQPGWHRPSDPTWQCNPPVSTGAAPAQYRRREEGDQAGPDTAELEGQAGQAGHKDRDARCSS